MTLLSRWCSHGVVNVAVLPWHVCLRHNCAALSFAVYHPAISPNGAHVLRIDSGLKRTPTLILRHRCKAPACSALNLTYMQAMVLEYNKLVIKLQQEDAKAGKVTSTRLKGRERLVAQIEAILQRSQDEHEFADVRDRLAFLALPAHLKCA